MHITPKITLLVPVYRARKGAHNNANIVYIVYIVYIRRRLVLLQLGLSGSARGSPWPGEGVPSPMLARPLFCAGSVANPPPKTAEGGPCLRCQVSTQGAKRAEALATGESSPILEQSIDNVIEAQPSRSQPTTF